MFVDHRILSRDGNSVLMEDLPFPKKVTHYKFLSALQMELLGRNIVTSICGQKEEGNGGKGPRRTLIKMLEVNLELIMSQAEETR